MKYSMEKKNKGTTFQKLELFIPCYDILNNEIYFSNYFTEAIIRKESFTSLNDFTDLKPERILLKSSSIKSELKEREFSLEEREEELCDSFEAKWKKMKLISGFKKNSLISDCIVDYFKRPLSSHFLHSQNLQLYSFNSCIPLPKVLCKYPIKVDIEFHLDSIFALKEESNQYSFKESPLFTANRDKEDLDLNGKANDNVLPQADSISHYIKDISLINVVDTLIKESICFLLQELSSEDKAKVLNDFYGKEYKFILKTKGTEEYLYGDYLIGSYGFVRSKARQYETIYLYLKKVPLFSVQPTLMHFPPLLTLNESSTAISNNTLAYYHLLEKYIALYPKREIVFRLYKPEAAQLSRYIKTRKIRQTELTEHTESSDCFFPLKLRLISLSNVMCLRNWLEDKHFNKNEMLLPNITYLPSKQTKGKCYSCCEHFFNKLTCKNKKKEELEAENEYNARMRLMSMIEKKNVKNEKLQEKLNLLRYHKKGIYFNYVQTTLAIIKSDTFNMTSYIEKLKDATPIERELKQKFSQFELDTLQLPIKPRYIRIRVHLLYGSYSLFSCLTQPVLLSDNILINTTMLFNAERFLIANLPFETRVGLTIEAYDDAIKAVFYLGSCQMPLYSHNGQMQTGRVTFNIWPNVRIIPRYNCSTQFSFKLIDTQSQVDMAMALPENSYPPETKKSLKEILSKMSPEFLDVIHIHNNNNEMKNKRFEAKANENDFNLNEHAKDKDKEKPKGQVQAKEKEKVEDETKSKKSLEDNSIAKSQTYCTITIEFPKFASPLIKSQKSSLTYRDYLEILHKSDSWDKNDFIEIRKLYGNSQKDISSVIENYTKFNLTNEETYLIDKDAENNLNANDSAEETHSFVPKNIWKYIKETLPLMVQILKKDPLERLREKDIIAILICRDYISTIPSALELFLRAIDWLNPSQVAIGHEYIKQWAQIDVEDAISLLDARFPDTKIREYAVSILRNYSDDLISMYMLQLCQCLLYETFLINPLSDFLIERSLMNPKLIGNSFFWNGRVNMKNPLFAERLSVYLVQIFMVSGDKFLNDCFDGVYLNYYFEFMAYYVKLCDRKIKKQAKEYAWTCIRFLTEELKVKRFSFPIDPTYFGSSFSQEDLTVFGSKMLPILLVFFSRELNDKVKVIFKIGDDLRQDVLTLQIMKIMDKLWLDNDLDLKVLPYKVCPTELKAGFIECVTGTELDKIQKLQGMSAALNQELIIQHLRGQGNLSEDIVESKTDNFIKSLAGYCVATCVIGVGDRHPGNIMIQSNGIFFHIDFGHILGNFKYKFGIKRERSPFLLTPEMANVYINAKQEEYFKRYCVKAFNILRHNAKKIINMFIIMSTGGMPELCGLNDLKYLKKMLVLKKESEEDAGNYFIGLIKQSKNEKFRLIDNIIHNLKH